MGDPTPIRTQLVSVLAAANEELGDEMVLSVVVAVRTKSGIKTFSTEDEPFYELLGMLEAAKVCLIEEALHQ